MANFDTIKTAIDANIKTNGNQAITGAMMNSVLKQMVDSTDAELTELSASIGNAFVRRGQGYYYDSGIYADNDAQDSTDILKCGKRLKGVMFLGGNSYPLYGITFFDKDKNVVSRFVGTSDKAALQDFNILCPDNAVYFVATNYNEYRESSYIYVSLYDYIGEIDLTKKILPMEKNIGDNLTEIIEVPTGGISQGIRCQDGKVRIKLSIIAGATNRTYNIYRFVNGAFSEIILAKNIVFGQGVIVDVPQGDDGIWVYIAGDNNQYTIECNILSKLLLEVKQQGEDIQTLKSELLPITGNLGSETILSSKKRIVIWLDNTPLNASYQVRVMCENPPVSDFNIYKAAPNHANLSIIHKRISFGTWVTIERDTSMPVLYIYNAEQDDTNVDARTYTFEFRTITSLAKDIEDLKIRAETGTSWDGIKVVCFGDSITEFADYEQNKTYADYIHDLTNAEVINIGIGGTQFRQRATPVSVPTNQKEAYAALDIVNMVKACCNKDYTKQIAATNYLTSNNIDRNDEIIARMQVIDWSDVDVVTIFAGTNDWNNASENLGDANKNNTDVNTTFGAINEIVKLLLQSYPHLVIYWFTPTVRWVASSLSERTEANWSDVFTRGNITLKEFSAKVEYLVRLHHIPICDMYNTLGWNQYNFSQYFLDTDGVHPRKGEGTLQIAKKMVAFINANKTF